MWFIVATLRRRPAGGSDNRRRLLVALGQRRALVTMNHIDTSDAPCREPPEAVLMGQDQCRLVLTFPQPLATHHRGMAKALALPIRLATLDALRSLIVCGCAAALIAAGQGLPLPI